MDTGKRENMAIQFAVFVVVQRSLDVKTSVVYVAPICEVSLMDKCLKFCWKIIFAIILWGLFCTGMFHIRLILDEDPLIAMLMFVSSWLVVCNIEIKGVK